VDLQQQIETQSFYFAPLLVALVTLFNQIVLVLSAVHPCTLHAFQQSHLVKMLHQITFIALLSAFAMTRIVTLATMMFNQGV